MLISALKWIADPVDLETEPLWKSDIWRLRLAFNRHVLGEFWRELDKTNAAQLYLIDRYAPKIYKDWVKLEASLWVKIWLTLSKLSQLFPSIQAPEAVFYRIIVEQKLVHLGLNQIYPKDEGIPSAKDMVRLYQRENEDLRNYINPFQQENSPFTFAFIGQVMSIAEPDSSFGNEYYKPILKARIKLQNFIETNNPVRFLPNPDTGRLEKYEKRTPQKIGKPPKIRSR